MTLTSIEGQFVLCTIDGEFAFDADNNIIMEDDKPKLINPVSLYLTAPPLSSGAHYWTQNVNDAHIFQTIDTAVATLLQLPRPNEIAIKEQK